MMINKYYFEVKSLFQLLLKVWETSVNQHILRYIKIIGNLK